ncbi:protein G12 [Anabrus simplex]|uniref:protein G12 n=1 Tax=Anabrus simplex TaxID=316456 RepID=UPI0035A290CE
MKFLFVLLLAVVHGCVSVTISTRDSDLGNDFQDFIKLIPVDKIREIVLDHAANDADLQKWIAYVQTDDFKNIILSLEAIPEYIEFLTYLEHSGVHIYEQINQLHEALKLPLLPIPPSHTSKRSRRSLDSMLDEIIAVLPREQLWALLQHKKQNSPAFKAFIARVQSDEFQGVMKKLAAIPEYVVLKQRLREDDVDVDFYIFEIKRWFGLI